jgi:putative transcription factor
VVEGQTKHTKQQKKMAANQDWGEVSWDKRGQKQKGETKEQQVNRAQRSGAQVVTETKYGAGKNSAAHPPTTAGINQKKLEEEDDIVKLAAPTMEMRKVLQQERTKAGLTQAELAQMCNVKPAIIQEYESGKGVPNPVMLGKIERALRAKNPALAFGTLTKAQKKV